MTLLEYTSDLLSAEPTLITVEPPLTSKLRKPSSLNLITFIHTIPLLFQPVQREPVGPPLNLVSTKFFCIR
jgi:hypothetical protein